ncbi:hypothetical protein CLV58_108167 [Spirosoma oryzae]|uniref:Uncharacterized protein n=1 Tax=Spirosoma oryzae TaxID=1469603 RepID=A0A2T0T0V4_9BACT|nr:hypothetical protein [Spirosoma oryzae]PRY39277.1 hypothetical protein CLV58_108167 [Spirosoma oryzae]
MKARILVTLVFVIIVQIITIETSKAQAFSTENEIARNKIILTYDNDNLYRSDSTVTLKQAKTGRLFLMLTLPLIAGSILANQNNQKGLAVGLASGAIATSGFSLYLSLKSNSHKNKK